MKKITLMTMIATTMAMGGCKMQENANTEVITEQAASDNALIAKSNNKHSIESFGKIGVNEYKEAFLKGMEKQNARIKEIINNPDAPTFANTIAALENSGEELERAEYTFEPIENSNSTQELRDLSKEMSPAFSKHNDDIYMNPALFSRVKKVYDDINSTDLTHEQKKVVEKIYKRFERNGANLNDADKARLSQLNEEISALQIQFSSNLLHETNNTFVTVDKLSDLEGLSHADIERAAEMAKEQGQEGKWMFNMQRTSCNPVLQYCKNRELRRKVYNAYCNRGNQGNEWDNKEICAKLVRLRLERAKLMGYKNCASQILDTRMAKTTDTLRVSTTPQMHCANCEKKIKGNIRFVKGVKKIETSVPKQTVTIVYDPRKSSMQDFVAAFQKIGFTINQVDNKK